MDPNFLYPAIFKNQTGIPYSIENGTLGLFPSGDQFYYINSNGEISGFNQSIETGAFLTTGAADNRYVLQINTGNFVTTNLTGSFLTTGAGDTRYVNTTGDIVSGQIHISGGVVTGNQTNLLVSQTWSGASLTRFTGMSVDISGNTHDVKSSIANFRYNNQDLVQILKVNNASGAISFGTSTSSPGLVCVPGSNFNNGVATMIFGTDLGSGHIQSWGGCNVALGWGGSTSIAFRHGQGLDIGSTATIAWQNNASTLGGNQDTYLGRQGVAAIRLGNNGSTKVDQTITAHHVTTSGGTGASLILTAGSGLSGFSGEVRISGSAIALNVRPTVNGTGVLLSGEGGGAANTGELTGAFYPLNSNPSGYITGVDLSNYTTTNYVTGVSGYLQGQITSLDNATGTYVTTGQTGSFVTTSQTGQFVATGQTGFLGKTAIGITIDGAGSAITAGSKGSISIPYNCTLASATLVADQVGSIVIDIKKSTYASFPTTSSIVGAGTKPTLSSAQKYTDSSLTNWTKTISAGDVLEYVVDSASTVTKVTLTLGATKYN